MARFFGRERPALRGGEFLKHSPVSRALHDVTYFFGGSVTGGSFFGGSVLGRSGIGGSDFGTLGNVSGGSAGPLGGTFGSLGGFGSVLILKTCHPIRVGSSAHAETAGHEKDNYLERFDGLRILFRDSLN